MRIYLSGPISGTTDDAIQGWRDEAAALLPDDVEIVDPASVAFDAALAYTRLEKPLTSLDRLRHGRLVVDRNRHLIQSSDVVLANLLHARRASIGSVGELFWANAFRVPLVIVREAAGNVHDHAMLNAIASATADNLEDGCAAALAMLRNATRVSQSPISGPTRALTRKSRRS